jgi:hypothetical protein
MSLIKRSNRKRDKARKAVRSTTKSARRTVKRKGAATLAKKLVPRRLLVLLGGAGAATLAIVTLRKRKGSDSGYTAPTGPPAAGS